MPGVEVAAAVLELSLSNLIANAIKYSDPAKEKRWVEIRARVALPDTGGALQTIVEVHDNGLGVPEANRARLFERFFRAHEASHSGIDGTGLGLSIVKDTVSSIGGRAWAEFTDGETVFCFSMPTRRKEDEARIPTPVTAPPAIVSGDQTSEASAH